MNNQRKWTEDIDNLIKSLVPLKEHGIKTIQELCDIINTKFSTNFSVKALSTHLAVKRISTGLLKNSFGRKGVVPIETERLSKDYIIVKVGKGKWKPKQVHIYEQAHGVKVDGKKQVVVFLDGNNRNFNLDNLELLERKYFRLYNKYHCTGDSIEISKIKILKVKLMSAKLDALDKKNMTETYRYDNYCSRRSKTYVKDYINRLKADPERYARYLAYRREIAKKNRLKMKTENPTLYKERMRAANARARAKKRAQKMEMEMKS